MNIIFIGISTFCAWLFALKFIKRTWKQAFFDATTVAFITGIAVYLLSIADMEKLMFPVELLIFLLQMLVTQLQMRDGYGNAVIALLVSQSAFSLIYMITSVSYEYLGMGALVYDMLYIGAGIWCAVLLRRRYPEVDYRSYYVNSMPEENRMELRLWHIYALLVVVCSLMTGYSWIYRPDGQIAMFLSNLICFCLFWLNILIIILMVAYKRERIEALVEQQYKNEMQSFMNVIRSQRHDYNFHVQTLAGLIRKGNMEECKRYVNALEQDSQEMNALLPIKDPAISALIHNFQILAARDGIPIRIEIQNDLSMIATNVYETNKIISNLLQNALDETRTHKDKTYGIQLCVLKRGEYCVIRVSNRVEHRKLNAEEMTNIYKQGYTTKQGHDGVGLSSIKQLCQRYRGTVYTNVEDDIIHFVAKVPINISKKQEEVE